MDLPLEPYRIRMVEPLRLLPREERLRRLREAHWNVFRLRSVDVFIDLLTDSGTGAMSVEQWAALMRGDEAYAGARSWEIFHRAVREVLGLELVLPVHQGRAGERILYTTLLRMRGGRLVPANAHFDTGRAVLLDRGAVPLDLPVPEALEPRRDHPFKGNMDVGALEGLLREKSGEVSFVVMVLTNNTLGGQPVSLENLRRVREVADSYGVPLVLDISRFAENAWFVREREPGQRGRSVAEIARDIIELGDHFVMSAKKDGLVNIGGFIATREPRVYEELAARVVLEEGFVTYGGLAGRDLEAMAQGLREVLDEDYLRHRVEQVRWLGEMLEERGVPILRPVGGHAVYVDAGEALPHIPSEQFPADALAAALYLESGVRAVGLGRLAFVESGDGGERPELLRLAVPRRTYTASQLGYVAESLARVVSNPSSVRGLRLKWEPRVRGVRHFLAKLEPV